jgi:sugar lactone lactonase YvrE
MNHDGGAVIPAPCRTITTWPKGNFAENLVVDSQGHVIVTLHNMGTVTRVDPRSGIATPVATFDCGVAGLALGQDGAIYVSGGVLGKPPGKIWQVAPDGTKREIATIADATFLNGMTVHPDGRRLLVADSMSGRIYAVATDTGAVDVWLADDRLRPIPNVMVPGVNGIKLFEGYAYISSTVHDTLYRGALAPDGSITALSPFADHLRADDFAFDVDGNLYIATHPANSLVRLSQKGDRATLGDLSQGMICPTAVAFGRLIGDERGVYVTTTGGVMHRGEDEIQEARLLWLDVGANGLPLQVVQ